MKTVIYSSNKKYYYVKELARGGSSWLSVEKHDEQPETEWISSVYQFDGEYFRTALPFPFWKVRSGENVQVSDDDELVLDYCSSEGKPSSLSTETPKESAKIG